MGGGKRLRKRARDARAPVAEGVLTCVDHRRARLLTLRVEAELLIFISQTGMNLAQAFSLGREAYRWQTDGDDMIAYRVYKGRRGGEAIFRCFRVYRAHLEKYLAWLTETGLAAESSKLFPFIYRGKVPPSHVLPKFTALHFAADQVGVQYFGPRSLRKTRVNWLLRRSGDVELTAEMAAHTTQTLLKHYEEPHHQRAATEITKFHKRNEPRAEAPGPGSCAGAGREPKPIKSIPPEAPRPDCVSPEGCLFCEYHRDILSSDYCWRLVTHSRIKSIELSMFRTTVADIVHPGARVIARIDEKLRSIASGSETRSQWVDDARDSVRSGRFHPLWDGHIRLLELFA